MTAQPLGPNASPAWDKEPVRHIAVFRALVLGDMLCATPALRALRARFPQARITLIGLPWARQWAARHPAIDNFIEFPGHPDLPERSVDEEAASAFAQRMQAQDIDLLIQLHGSGRVVNQMLAQWGARRIAAFCEPAAHRPDPDLCCQWPEQGTEVERLLRLTDHLGAPRQGLSLDFPLTQTDLAQADALLASVGITHEQTSSLVCIHPGAQLPSRRWSPVRFAQIAEALQEQGRTVVLTGTADEQELGQAIQATMRRQPANLIGRTSLWTFGALIRRADLVVCNDTGASHVAAALGTPSVVISCGADVARWSPADTTHHHVLWAPMACRPCAHRVCPYEHGCASDIGTAMVWDAIQRIAPIQIARIQEFHA